MACTNTPSCFLNPNLPPMPLKAHQQLGEGDVGLQDVQQLESQAGAVDGEHVACDAPAGGQACSPPWSDLTRASSD